MYDPSNPALGRLRDAGSNWMMFGYYIMNNIGIAFQCYATGVLLGVGSVFFIAMNGAFGGAIARLRRLRGLRRHVLSLRRRPLGVRADRHRALWRGGIADRHAPCSCPDG